MRRPSPLPAPPLPASTVGASTAGASRPDPESPDDVGLPGAADEAGQAGAENVTATTLVGDTGAGPATPPIRMRDVWRAARAHRRALRAEVRRFTGRQRRRRAIWVGVAASALLLVAGTVGAAYSPLFAVQDIQVVGTHALDAATVEKALGSQLGKPFPLVDESAVKAALVRFPLVETYTLEARPPHDLVVRIVERTPIGAIHDSAGYTVVDSAGVPLSTTPDPPAGVPALTVTGGIDSDAFRSLGAVMRALPAAVRAQVTAASATTPDDVILHLGRATVVWGSADQSADKALVLERTMQARPPSSVTEYDVSTPAAVVVR